MWDVNSMIIKVSQAMEAIQLLDDRWKVRWTVMGVEFLQEMFDVVMKQWGHNYGMFQ